MQHTAQRPSASQNDAGGACYRTLRTSCRISSVMGGGRAGGPLCDIWESRSSPSPIALSGILRPQQALRAGAAGGDHAPGCSR